MTVAMGWNMNTVTEKLQTKTHLQHAQSMHDYKGNH
jgi:hypothetical protein